MKFYFVESFSVEAMSPMKMTNRYAENMQKFFFRLMVPSHDNGKLTQPMRGSER